MTTIRARSNQWYIFINFVSKVLINLVLLAISLACLLPFLVIVSASLTNEEAIGKYGYPIIPKVIDPLAYKFIFADPSRIIRAYSVSSLVTITGASIGMLFMSMAAYALSRRQFALRQPIAFYIFFTMLFNGGLVPSYILITQYLKLQNTIWVLIIPGLINGWHILILRTFFQDLPSELLDAAKIDGASEWRIFFQIAIPLTTPGLATIGLFTMLRYWNDWYTALLYIDKDVLYPIQYLLYTMMRSIEWLQMGQQANVMEESVRVPILPARMAMTVLAIGPMAFGYLFVQKYFIRGIRLGAIKG
ncbi:MAG: carbohydrate ABC transporter permease [Anaerolineae bacterium]|nr:carbohydrate ABC transporter permease [Anaerolineae bacterium]